jgi:hypothetical protein
MMQSGLKLRHLLFASAFILAVIIRAAAAGRPILTDAEAVLALQVLAISSSEDVLLLPHPAYLALTVPLMFLFGALEWAARFWPIVAGSLLVLAPVLFQRWIGPFPAVLLAFLLALDPGLAAVSLQVGSMALALLFVILSLGFWLNDRAALAGISGGMALLSGPAAWPGILGLLIAYFLARWLTGPPLVDRQTEISTGPVGIGDPAARRMALLFAIGTFFLAGTLFFILPRGLSAAAASLPAYLGSWTQPSGIAAVSLLLALLLYALLPLVFGLYGAATGWLRGERADRFLLIWFLVSLVLALLNPGRQVTDLAWPLLPLLGLAARQLARLVSIPRYDRLAVVGQAVLVAIILGFMSMALAALSNRIVPSSPQVFSFRLAGAAVMLIASTGLIAWGWSKEVALRGFAWGAALVLLFYSISSTWYTVGYAGGQAAEMWNGPRHMPEAHLMQQTIAMKRQLAGPVKDGPEVVVAGVDSPALRWSLRGFANVQFFNHLSSEASPPMIITQEDPGAMLAASYRGQSFTLVEHTNWNAMQLLDWPRWLVFRTAPGQATVRERVILWVRTDIFPGDEVSEQAADLEDPVLSGEKVSPR